MSAKAESITEHPLFKNRTALFVAVVYFFATTFTTDGYWKTVLFTSGMVMVLMALFKEWRSGTLESVLNIMRQKKLHVQKRQGKRAVKQPPKKVKPKENPLNNSATFAFNSPLESVEPKQKAKPPPLINNDAPPLPKRSDVNTNKGTEPPAFF